jgi:hypothetical protein
MLVRVAAPPLQPVHRLAHAAAQAPQLEPVRAAVRGGLRLSYRLPRAFVPSRSELPHLLNRRGLVGCAVEVGVKQGEFSELLLERWRGRHLISVDPWLEAPPSDYVDVANVPQGEHEAFYAETQRRLARFGDRSSIWRMLGDEAAERIPHHSLDFVYLDARHDEPAVRSDLETWFPKVRPGGVIAGHDYVDGTFPDGEFGVRSAVTAFAGARGLPVHATLDGPWISWWLSVPR